MKHRFIALIGWLLLGSQLLLAQPSYTCQYWFDGNYNSHFDTSVTTGHWQTLIETGHLPFGLHTLYMHLQDSSGRWTAPRSFLFLRTEDTLSSHAPSYTCWFDQDRNGTLQQGIIGNGTLLIDVATIDNGLHTFNLQLGDGLAARLHSFLFYKVPMADSSGLYMTYSCWFDQDTSTMQSGNVASGHLLIDATGISIGLHTLNLQLNAGSLTQLQSYMFYRMPILDTGTAQMVYRCWFDQDYTSLQQGSIGNGHLLIETASLSDGLHTLNLELGSGRTAQLSSHLFMKMPSMVSTSDTTPLRWHYSIDGRDYPPISVSRNGGLIHLELDVSTLTDGLHTLSHFLMTQQGTTFGVKSSLFYKIPLGGNGVKRYEYWFNDDYDNRVAAVLDTVADPFRLVRLLDVDTLSFRSTSFQFDPNGGNPRCYAKNQVTFRFIDAMYRYVSQTAEFVDQRVMRLVTADTLERDTTKVIAAPQGNNIHWFKLYAGVGDSLSFHTDRPCTIQLFAPSGEEVISTSGSNVLTWTGCHAWEDGVYYLAVHDAEGTGTLSVSYQWIYRYAVLSHTPNMVGNAPSMMTVNLWGNGYDKLTNVYFINTDTVWAMDSILVSNMNEAFIDFVTNWDLSVGYYDMLLEFNDGIGGTDSIKISNALRVVAGEYGDVEVRYDYVSSFTEPHIINMTISNTGNVPYMAVPIVVAYTRANVSSISFNRNNLQLDSLEVMDSLYHNATDLFGRGIEAKYLPLVLDRLLPYQTVSLQLEFKCPRGGSFDFYSWAGRPWSRVSDSESHRDNLYMEKGAAKASMCNMPDPCDYLGEVECMCGTFMGTIKALAGGMVAPVLKGRRQAQQWYEEQGGEDQIYRESQLQTPESILREALSHCTPDAVETAATAFYAAWDEIDGDDCPPPTPIHPSVPAPPVDPNEITGYSATSGSKAIGEHISQLPYIIEFENDSLLAMGLAHIIVVRDTLDGQVLDLESFNASSITIGESTIPVSGQQFVRTVDMRPNVDVLAQVQLEYRIDTGFAVATWTFTSIDPMTLLPTTADTLGFLSIGGTGEVDFTINRLSSLADSATIPNRAWIVFDNEEPIATSTWVNIVDNTPPRSSIDSLVFRNDSVAVSISATDNLSGVWRYNVYGQVDNNWLPLAMNLPADTIAVIAADTSLYSAFRTIAIDSAGNVEPMHVTVYDTMYVTACDSYRWEGNTYTNGGIFTARVTASNNVYYDTVRTLSLTVNHGSSRDTSATVCDVYRWRGGVYTSSGTYYFNTTNATGCDSTVTLHLTINHSTTGDTTATACDSFTWRNTNYTNSTNGATHVLTNADGCDSTVTLHLTVNHSTTSIVTVTACDSFIWWNTNYTNSTNGATHVLTNVDGCDSTVTLHLTVNHSTAGDTTATACDNFTWWNTNYTNSTNGATHVLTNADGCDSTVTLHLTIHFSTAGDTTATACDNFTWWNTNYTNSTNGATHVLTNADGCDSTVTLHLTVNHSNSGDTTATACNSFTWWNTNYTSTTNSATHVLTNTAGCDSTVTLHLTVNHSTTGIETVTACDSYTWHGTTYTSSTNTPTYSTTNAAGCDSTVTLHLTINQSTSTTWSIGICQGDSLFFNDRWIDEEGEYRDTLQSALGCDSTVLLMLIIYPTSETIVTDTACDSYEWMDGMTYTTSTDSPTITLPNMNRYRCDSIVRLNLTVNYSSHDTIVDSAAGSYYWQGNTYTESGEYLFEGQTVAGCDSVVVLRLTITPVGIDASDSLWAITVYPNPAKGMISIEGQEMTGVDVYDATGRRAAHFEFDGHTSRASIDIHHLPAGVYTLRIGLADGYAIRRLIKR